MVNNPCILTVNGQMLFHKRFAHSGFFSGKNTGITSKAVCFKLIIKLNLQGFSGKNTAKSTKKRENSVKIIQKDIFCYYLMLYQFEILESRLYVGKIQSSRFHTYHVV